MPGKEKDYLLHIESLGHAALVFVSKSLQGSYYVHLLFTYNVSSWTADLETVLLCVCVNIMTDNIVYGI